MAGILITIHAGPKGKGTSMKFERIFPGEPAVTTISYNNETNISGPPGTLVARFSRGAVSAREQGQQGYDP